MPRYGKVALIMLIVGLLSTGCAPPTPPPPPNPNPTPTPTPTPTTTEVEIEHSPVIAKSAESVTFTATVTDCALQPCEVQILVNTVPVTTCSNLSAGDTCAYTGGPYTAYEGTTVSYLAAVRDSAGGTKTRGYYYFAITADDYSWSFDFMPARRAGSDDQKEDLVFHRASDYASFGDFVDDVEDKMYDVLGEQDVIERPDNYDTFNFWVYTHVAAGTDYCGTLHADADTDMPWRDIDAILHTTSFGDCCHLALRRFTAEGHNTKAFLHECGHGCFRLADEYDAYSLCRTYYFESACEPNIWDTEEECRAEQTAKSRDADECWEFTACQGGWWGIHSLTDDTVMQVGLVGDPWGIEATEHVVCFFDAQCCQP